MVSFTAESMLMVLAFAASVQAVDPSPDVRKKWDDKCKASTFRLLNKALQKLTYSRVWPDVL
jgi:hypothetical protein